MAISSSLSKKNKVGSKKSSSRTSIEQQALEGRGRKIYKYFKKMDVNLEDMSLLYLSWLWMYCDPNRDLSVDEFMEMTEDQIHERFDDLKSKGHIQTVSYTHLTLPTTPYV